MLSHRSAAALWDLRPIPALRAGIDVTVPGRTRRGRPGIVLHSVRRIDPRDLDTVDGLPVTSVHRTLLDYAETASPRQLRGAIEAAERRDLLDLAAIDGLSTRSRGRHGLKALAAISDDYGDMAQETWSALEAHFLELIRSAGIPEPAVNVSVAGIVVDFFWPQARLVVEIDSWRFQRSPCSFEEDRDRDVRLHVAGCDVLRFTRRRVHGKPRAVVGAVRTMLSAVSASGAASDR